MCCSLLADPRLPLGFDPCELDSAMKPSDPLTFVVGIVPFSQVDSAPAKARRDRACSPTTSTTPDEAAPSALLPLQPASHLLGRQLLQRLSR